MSPPPSWVNVVKTRGSEGLRVSPPPPDCMSDIIIELSNSAAPVTFLQALI